MEDVLFTTREKITLAVICFLVFSLPLISSVVLFRLSTRPLVFDKDNLKSLALGTFTTMPNTDDEAMANYFLNAATDATRRQKPDAAAAYLSQAKNLTTSQSDTANTDVQRIAAGSGTQNAKLDTQSSTNTRANTITFPKNQTEFFVKDAKLHNDTQVYLTLNDNHENAIIYVKQKQAGVGFTLASTQPLNQDVSVTWYEIKE